MARYNSRRKSVIPSRANIVSEYGESFQLLVCRLPTFAVDGVIKTRLDSEPGRGCRSSDECKHHIEAAQRLAGPVHADVAEQFVFDRIPFGATGRIVTNRYGQTEGIAQLLL